MDKIEVRRGQTWEKNGLGITALVLDVDFQFRRGKREQCALMHPSEGYSSYVSVARLKSGKTPWKLIKDVRP